jgi:hypothetical protein
MKKLLSIFVLLALLIVVVTTPNSSCTNSNAAKTVDLARDLKPVIEPTEDVVQFIEKFRVTKNDQHGALLEANPWINQRVLIYARETNAIPKDALVDSTVYYWGTQKAQATDKSGKLFRGKIIDELVCFIYVHNKKEPTGVIVFCMNGALGLLKDELARVGKGNGEFRISEGEGINHHVDYQTAIRLAEQFNLPLYKGKIQREKFRITPSKAKTMENSVDKIQITVQVYTGDYFNLNTNTYTPANPLAKN